MLSKCLDCVTLVHVQPVRWQVCQMAGKVVHHSGAVLLKVDEGVLSPSGLFWSGSGGFGAGKEARAFFPSPPFWKRSRTDLKGEVRLKQGEKSGKDLQCSLF